MTMLSDDAQRCFTGSKNIPAALMECTGEDTEKVVAVVAMDEGGGDIDGNY